MIATLGMVGAVVLPLFNIALMTRIRKRKSSNDISMVWTIGVFSCVLIMLPSALVSTDSVFKLFSIINTLLFSGVVYHVLRYRK